MRLIFVIILLSLSFRAYSTDTLLVAFHSEMIFYNIEVSRNNELFVGTSKGLHQINESNISKVNDQAGYINYVGDELIYSTSLNIERSKKFNTLLPPSYHTYQHQSYFSDNFLYLITKGNLFIYTLNKYSRNLPGISIRAFSSNSIGTYSGIYCYGDKLEIPSYTSGQILEKDSTFYICYDGLAVYKDKNTSFFNDEITGQTLIGNTTLGSAREIFSLTDKSFILSSTEGLYHLNQALDSAVQIISSKNQMAPVIVSIYEENITNTVTFVTNQKLYRYGFGSQNLRLLTELPEIIEDGIDISITSSTEYLLLGSTQLYRYSIGKGVTPITKINSSAHTIALLDLEKAIITSQNGAYLYDLTTNQEAKFFESIEFNKGALWVEDQRVRMGTVDGYYDITFEDLNDLIAASEPQDQTVASNSYFFPISITVAFLVLSMTLIYYKRKGVQSEAEKLYEANSENINEYIVANLNQASVKSLCAHFDISTKTLYKLTSPQKPGQLITELKTRRVKELLAQGEELKAISQLSGYSVNYLKKLLSR